MVDTPSRPRRVVRALNRSPGFALPPPVAREIALWNEVRLEPTLEFLRLRQREDDPVVRALLDVLPGVWLSAPATTDAAT